jgi:UDP-N-acetylglucosamine 2-epimerase
MILFSFGTRPEYLKIKPILNLFDEKKISYRTLFTGQHVDLLKNIDVDQHITIKNSGNRLDSVIGSIMNNVIWTDIDHVLVQGDTSSVLGVALSAFHNKIPVIHLEAGLRTFDKENPYPEEMNRMLVSRLADYHLCPTTMSMRNLSNEWTDGKMSVVGNTALDNLLEWKDKCEYTDKVLITLHRRENHHWMDQWFNVINEIANKYPELEFIFPVHPNPNVRKHKDLLTAKNIEVINPLDHNDLLEILVKTRLVITDSGGIQEECSFFNKICLTCRKVTERPEAIGQSTHLVKSPLQLSELFSKFVVDYNVEGDCPFGDGHSTEKIYDFFKLWKIIE